MSYLVQVGTDKDLIQYQGSIYPYNGGSIPNGFVVYDGALIADPDDDTLLLMVWDNTLVNIREMNLAERAAYEKIKKIKQLTIEAVRRARLIYVDDGFDELHFKLLIDIDNTYNRPGSTANRITQVTNIGTVWTNTKAIINSMTDYILIKNYDVVNSPVWPV